MKEKRKIWKATGLFLLPLIVGLILLFIFSNDKRFQYYFIKDNCMEYSGWIYDRLHNNKRDVDIAFTGSSKVINAINSEWVENELRKNGVDMKAANLGFCRLGRNMHYALLKETFATKHPKYIIIEVSEKENRDGHMDFGYLADAVDIWLPVLIFNDNIFEDIYKATIVRFEAIKQKLTKDYVSPPIKDRAYGYVPDSSLADVVILNEIKARKVKEWKYNKGFSRWFYNQQSFRYIDKIVAMAKKHNCKVLFLYLPGYGSIPLPEEHEFFKSRGTLLIPPGKILDDAHNWKDELHMNDYGAQQLSAWLAGQLLVL